jgi:hypothetical protein
VVDLNRREVRWRGEVVRLTKLDFELMSCLAQRPIRAWSFEGFSMKHGMIHTDMIETSYTQPYAGCVNISDACEHRLPSSRCTAGASF